MKNFTKKRIGLLTSFPIVFLILILFLRFDTTSEIDIVGKWKAYDGKKTFIFNKNGYVAIYDSINKTTMQGDEWNVKGNMIAYYIYQRTPNKHYYQGDDFTESFYTSNYERIFNCWEIITYKEDYMWVQNLTGTAGFELNRIKDKE